MKSLSELVFMRTIAIVFSCLLSLPAWGDDHSLKILAVHFPPYEFEEPVDGLKGFDVEMVEEVFRRMGKAARVEFLPWSRAVEIVYSGREMALLSCGRDKEREAYLYYSDPISIATYGYFVREDYAGPVLKSLLELRGQKVVAVLGYTSQKTLKNLEIVHTTVRTDKIALNILVAERTDIFFASIEGNIFIANQMGIADKLRHYSFYSTNYHLCFSKKWPGAKELLVQFNDGLSQLKADGTYDAIHDKYR